MDKQIAICSTILFDENSSYTLEELCDFCKQDAVIIEEMVNEGLLVPVGHSPKQWRFGLREIKRAQTARRLITDLRVNVAGAALALDLLEELEELRRK